MKIYTKTGDDGKTSLFGGKRLPKYADRIECYGTVDELNSFVGLLNDSLGNADVNEMLLKIQHNLFNIGSVLATDPDGDIKLPGVDAKDIETIELAIDKMQEELPELKNFILPGGEVAVSVAHICRTVCRRAERRVVGLANEESVDPNIILFLNRLSDYFFVLARFIGFQMGIPEVKWESK
jgi:cob(I)alamin adenosyltransferase